MQTSQITDHAAVTKIARVVSSVLPKFSNDYTVKPVIQDSKYGVYLEIHFMRADPKYAGWAAAQTFSWKVHEGTLYISDTYVPEEMRGKGFLGACLSKIRQIPELNGTAVVHVAVNQAWPKILQRAGFTQKKVSSHLLQPEQ